MKKLWPVLVLALAILFAFYPAWLKGRIPLNGRNLAAFYSPWFYTEFAGFPAGVPSKPGIPDQLRLYYPYMHLTQQTYRRGQLPLWNPHQFAGNPHMAEWQSGVFYPLHLLMLFMPLPVYWTLFQMAGLFLAGLFTYFYLKNLKLSPLSALFGGLSFMLSTFMFTWNQEVIVAPHSILWLPLVLLSVDRVLKSKGHRWWLIGPIGLVLSILSGYWQTTFYVLVTSLAYIFFKAYSINKTRSPGRRICRLLAWFPLAFGLTAFQLLPTIELYQRSSRALVNTLPRLLDLFKDFLLQPRHLITLLIPDFFGHPTTRNWFSYSTGNYYEYALFIGTVPLIFILTAILALLKPPHGRLARRLRGGAWFFTLLAIISFSFAFNLPHSRLVFDAKIPLLSTGIANRILFLPAFSLSALAAFGLEVWLKKTSSKFSLFISTGLISLIFVVIWIFLLQNQSQPGWHISLRNSILPTSVFILFTLLMLLSFKINRYFIALAIIVLSLSQNLYQFFKFTPFSEPQFVYPSHPTIKFLQHKAGLNRFLGYHGTFLRSNFATYYGLYSAEGFDSLNDKTRTQLIHSASTGKLSDNLPRSADAILDRDITNPRTLRLMSLLGIRYLVDHPEYIEAGDTTNLPDLPPDQQQLVWQDGDWQIFKYRAALPRAFLASDYIVEPNPQKTLDLIYDPQINLREQLVLNQPPPLDLADDPQEQVDITFYSPTKIVIKTQSSTNQLLFLSDTLYPGWHAAIDNQPAPIYRADLAFRAIPVPAGSHHVVMTYFPDSFRNGLIIAGLSLGVILCLSKIWPKLA